MAVSPLAAVFLVLLGYTAGVNSQSEAYTAPQPAETTARADSTTTEPLPTYPPIPNPFMEIELEGEMYSSYSMSISCINSYSRQFNDILRGQLQRAKQEMLATPTFCPATTNADLTAAYTNMVAVGSQVYLRYGVDIVSYGANTLGAMSSCAWQLGAYLSNFNNWRQPIWSDIFNCPRLTFLNYGFNQTDILWIC